jgi:mannose/fructose/N-acetylgalactosamine-specific phosphotransferase system component IIB
MVNMLRLDERLIHGQVATMWVKTYPIDSLLVVDDDTVKDPLSIKTLQMAAMSIQGVKTFIKSTEDALKILCDPRCETRKVMVVCRQLKTTLEIAEKAPHVAEINLGNYGRMMLSDTPRKTYYSNLLFNEEEAAVAKKITELPIEVYYQATPDTAKINLRGVFDKEE